MRMKQLIYWNTNVLDVVKYLNWKSQKVWYIESESKIWEWKVKGKVAISTGLQGFAYKGKVKVKN